VSLPAGWLAPAGGLVGGWRHRGAQVQGPPLWWPQVYSRRQQQVNHTMGCGSSAACRRGGTGLVPASAVECLPIVVWLLS
jgi:hypothetical protein